MIPEARFALYMFAFVLLAGFIVGGNAGLGADTREEAKVTAQVSEEQIGQVEAEVPEEAQPFYYDYLPESLTPEPTESSVVMENVVKPMVMFTIGFAEVVALFFYDNQGWLPITAIVYATQGLGYLLVGGILVAEGRRTLRLSREVMGS